MHMGIVLLKPEDGIRFSGAEITDVCEPTDMGAVNWTQILSNEAEGS